MKRVISIAAIIVMCCLLCSCGSGLLSSPKGTITFELPAPPSRGWEGYSRNAMYGNWYYQVIVENTSTGKVIHNKEYSQSETVTINDIEPGSYKVSIALFEENDVISLFLHNIVETSSGSATCTVKAGETTPVTIEMSLQKMYGWRLEIGGSCPVVPYYAVNNCCMSYHWGGEQGGSYNFGIINPAKKEDCSCTVTVTVDGTSVQASHGFGYHAKEAGALVDLSEDGTKLTSKKIAEAVAAEKAFTVDVWVSAEEQYTIDVPSRFAKMCNEIDAACASETIQEGYISSDSFFGTGTNKSSVYIFKDNPLISVIDAGDLFSAEATANGTKSALDYVDLGSAKYTDLIYSQLVGKNPDRFIQGLGKRFDSFDALKASFTNVLTAGGTELYFYSSANGGSSLREKLSADATAALASWLGVELLPDPNAGNSNPGGNPRTTLTLAFTGTTPSEWEAWVLDSSEKSVATMSNSSTSCEVPSGTYSIVMKGMQSYLGYVGAKKNVAVSGTEKEVTVNVRPFYLMNNQQNVTYSCYSQLSYNRLPTSASLSVAPGTTFQGWMFNGGNVTGLAALPDTTNVGDSISFQAQFSEPETTYPSTDYTLYITAEPSGREETGSYNNPYAFNTIKSMSSTALAGIIEQYSIKTIMLKGGTFTESLDCLVINDLTLDQDGMAYITYSGSEPLFTIPSDCQYTINRLQLSGPINAPAFVIESRGTLILGSNGDVQMVGLSINGSSLIENSGTLILNKCVIADCSLNSADGALINNMGTLELTSNSVLDGGEKTYTRLKCAADSYVEFGTFNDYLCTFSPSNSKKYLNGESFEQNINRNNVEILFGN